MTTDKINSEITAFWFVILLLFIVLGFYGRQAIEWLLMKLYDLFIQKGSIK